MLIGSFISIFVYNLNFMCCTLLFFINESRLEDIQNMNFKERNKKKCCSKIFSYMIKINKSGFKI